MGTRMRDMARQAFPAFEWVMDEGAGLFLHQLFVALPAEVRIDRLEKCAFIRTVAVMARHAITTAHRSVHMRLLKFGLHLRMARVTDHVGSVDEDAGDVRTMGIVATRALLLLIRRMQLPELFCFFLYLGMARKTQLAVRGDQKPLVRRGMRTMAGEATVFTLYGLMLVGHPRARILMAREAELVAGLHEQSRLLGCVWIMTFEARTVFEWLVLNRAALGQIFKIVAVAA